MADMNEVALKEKEILKKFKNKEESIELKKSISTKLNINENKRNHKFCNEKNINGNAGSWQKFNNRRNYKTKNVDIIVVNERKRGYTRKNNHRNFTTEKSCEKIKRSVSTNQKNQRYNSYQSQNKENEKEIAAVKERFSLNDECFDYYEDEELDEPFSDSDEEKIKFQKPNLIIPRGRIRTLSGTVPPNGYSPKWGGPTMCLCCFQFFDLPDSIGKFANHLLEDHQIVVEDVDLIVDPKRYIEYWRQRFANEPVHNIFPKIFPDEQDPYFNKTEYYFEMSERLPEDYSLRQRIAMRRLEEALACQQREREDTNFSMQCIFCRHIARGNRSKIIHHLYMIHHLNLGSPDNLVFVNEYIDHLKERIQKNECLYCEKKFSDRIALMDHMRKRNHREVNPKNNYYDKFYIINYLELGKRWLDVLAEDFEDTMPTFIDSDDEEEEESWHEWHEDNMDIDQVRSVCLFCNYNAELVTAVLDHMTKLHQFNILEFFEKEKFDFYDRMKFLNFVRKESFSSPGLRQNTDELKPITLPEREKWLNDENLVPMFGNDHLLWMLESHIEEKKILKNFETNIDLSKIVIEGDWDQINLKFSNFKRQTSVESMLLTPVVENNIFKEYIEQSKINTVKEIIVEEWVDFSNSVLSKIYKSLR